MRDQHIPATPRVAVIGKGAADLAVALGVVIHPLEGSDVALFIVSATDGIVRADSDLWLTARESYIPSLVVISDLDSKNDLDFEDMTAIASKMLDPVATPYLVLHDEASAPVALIDLTTMKIRDYSVTEITEREADPEHREIVAEFSEEYLETCESAGEDGFQNGLLYPALPWVPSNNLGVAEILRYINLVEIIPSAS